MYTKYLFPRRKWPGGRKEIYNIANYYKVSGPYENDLSKLIDPLYRKVLT